MWLRKGVRVKMVEWLAGNRIRGTTAERPALGLPSGSVGGWVEVGRTTLGSAGDTIDVSSLANKRYYMVLGDKQSSGTSDFNWRVGNGSADSGNNYARRQSSNGGSDTTNTSYSRMFADNGGASTPSFQVGYFANLSGKEKLNITHSVSQSTAGAGNAPTRRESVNKWANTSNPIDVIQGVNVEGGDFASGSEVVVLGWDPDDTHTTNFWEQLASVELSSSGDTLSSGTITAKKYLWVQSFTKGTGGATRSSYTMNSDGGNNYGYRYSVDGATDATGAGQANLYFNSNTTGNTLTNSFIINNSANEKLVISHTVKATSTGASTAPSREENVGKWANTSSQITSIQMLNSGAGSFDTGSFIKVWGSN